MGRDAFAPDDTIDSVGFNPRARMGRDVAVGAVNRLPLRRFNPRARMGRDVAQVSGV